MKSKLYQDENYLRHLHYELHMLPSKIAKITEKDNDLYTATIGGNFNVQKNNELVIL